MRLQGSPKAFTVFGLLIGLLLAGCAAGENDGNSYPELSSVPSESRPSLPVETRRKIVRGLIKERDESRRQTAVVRGRSGLSTSAFDTLEDTGSKAETIIPDGPAEAETFSLRGEGEGDTNSSYRSGAQFEDGSLDDFIRQLERDTSPGVPVVPEEPASEDAPGDATSFLLFETDDASSVVLAAFAPVVTARHDLGRDVLIRLAADGDEDDSSFFCDWFGWSVGMLGACLKEGEAQTDGKAQVEDDTKADVNDQAGAQQQNQGTGSGSGTNRREEAERRLRGDDASDAIENLSRDALDPVKSSLEKLRDFMRARRSSGPDESPAERRAYRSRGDAGADDASVDPPPIPLVKPKVRSGIRIEDGGETFEFRRMRHPAFKPAAVMARAESEGSSTSTSGKDRPNESTAPPASQSDVAAEEKKGGGKPSGSAAGPEETKEPSAPKSGKDEPADPTPSPSAGKGDVVDKQKEGEAKTAKSAEGKEEAGQKPQETKVAARTPDDAQTEQEASSAFSETKELLQIVPLTMFFDSNEYYMSRDNEKHLKEILAYARKNDQKLRVISEASSLEDAEKRTIVVKAALQRMDAEGDVLIYEFDEIPYVDQVRFELETPSEKKPTEATPAEE